MAVQLTTAGNFRARTRRTEPTGEKHRITWMWDKANVWRGVVAEVRCIILADIPSGSTVLSRSQCPWVGGSLLQSPENVAGYLSEPVFSFSALHGAEKYKAAPHLAG